MTDVKAMILAAGYGQRMQPLSNRCPKPLLPILGRPMVDYALEQLASVGIRDVGINTHHLAQEVVEHVEKEFSKTLQLVFSYEAIIRGTGGGMRGLRDFLAGDEPFLVHNGDVFSTVNLCDVIAYHREHAPLVTLVLIDYPPVNSITISEEGAIIDFYAYRQTIQNLQKRRNLTFAGISIVDPAILDLIPGTIPYNIVDLYNNLIKTKRGSIQGFISHTAYWIDVGTPAAYLNIHRDILLYSKAQIPGLQTPSTLYQGAGCVLDPTAQFAGFVSLGENCRIEPDVSLKDCVVWNNSVITSGTHFHHGVIDGTWAYRIT